MGGDHWGTVGVSAAEKEETVAEGGPAAAV